MEKAAKIKLFLLLAFLAVSAIILGKVYLFASSPSSVKVMVYKVELMTDASDTNPQVIFSNDTGHDIDLADEADALIGQAEMPAGTYKRIRMTVANGIKQSIADAADNPCGGEAFTDRVFPVAEGKETDSQVHIDFAAHDDNGGTWKGSRITHFLLGPVTVSENKSIEAKLRFKTANTLFCSGGAVKMRSPWAIWAEIL
jgi:hypothetical protein